MATAGTVKRKASGGLKDIIENKLESPIFLIVTGMLVLRSAQVYSGSAFIMSRLLGPFWPTFEVITGIGLAIGGEMLMTIAGRTWQSWLRFADEVATQPRVTKIAREANRKAALRKAESSKTFMQIGAAASIYAGISYLISNAAQSGSIDIGVAINDVVPTILITSLVYYLGVQREKIADSTDTDALVAEIDTGMNDALKAAIDRFKNGTSSEQDNNFIAESLPPHKSARFRRAVAKKEAGEMWTAAQIRQEAGIEDSQKAVRDINRQINTLAKDNTLGIHKADDGRTWLIPKRVVLDNWGELIFERRVRIKDATRSLVGQSDTMEPGSPTSSPVTVRRPVARRDAALKLEEPPEWKEERRLARERKRQERLAALEVENAAPEVAASATDEAATAPGDGALDSTFVIDFDAPVPELVTAEAGATS